MYRPWLLGVYSLHELVSAMLWHLRDQSAHVCEDANWTISVIRVFEVWRNRMVEVGERILVADAVSLGHPQHSCGRASISFYQAIYVSCLRRMLYA